MNIASEKEEIIKRFKLVHDMDLINAIKNLLDFGLYKQSSNDAALEDSIDRAIAQSEKGMYRPHEDVMGEIRNVTKHELPDTVVNGGGTYL